MNLKGRNFSLELVVLQKFIEAEEFATGRAREKLYPSYFESVT